MLITIFAAELLSTVHRQSLSWDEDDHIFAGYMGWKHHDFGINPEHPPLVKALATLPMLAMHLKTFPPEGNNFKTQAYFGGRDMLFGNGGEAVADRIVFADRAMASLISLLMAALVFLWARRMFGVSTALFALTLVVFEPNLIAHGAYVTTDMGVTCFLFASCFALYCYAERPSWWRLALLGLAGGAALAAKHSAVLVLPIVVLLAIGDVVMSSRVESRRRAVTLALGLAGASAIAIFFLWAMYDFRFAMRPPPLTMHPTLAEYVSGLKGSEPKIYLFLAKYHLLPESYIFGMADVRLVSINFPSYIFGTIYAHGVWFYFPAAFLIKSTAAFLGLLVVALVALVMRRLPVDRRILYLLLPPIFYMAVAMATGLNIGARHILPMYPFLCIFVAAAAIALGRCSRAAAWGCGLLLFLHVFSSVRAYPYAIAYSNEFWGGPAKTYRYLTDSNADWGQQLFDVKKYIAAHHIHACYFAYFVDNAVRPQDYGIPCKSLPTADTGWNDDQVDTPAVIAGPVFISAGTLTGYEFGSNVLNPYRAFQTLTPDAVIDHGVFVYNGTFPVPLAHALGYVTEANRLLEKKQVPAALEQAKLAVAADPEAFQAQMALGDAEAAAGDKAEARGAYQHALSIAKTMEPQIQSEWVQTIQKKMQ